MVWPRWRVVADACSVTSASCCGELDAVIGLDMAVRAEGLRGAMQGTRGG